MVQTRSARKGPAPSSYVEATEEVEPIQLQTPATTRKRAQKPAKTPTTAAAPAGALQSPTLHDPQSPAPATPATKQPTSAATPSKNSNTNASKNKQFIAELRSKWHAPETSQGRLVDFLRTLLFQTDYLLGAYFFDWWETAMVYPIYMVIVAVVSWAIYRQSTHAWEVATRVIQQYTQQ